MDLNESARRPARPCRGRVGYGPGLRVPFARRRRQEDEVGIGRRVEELPERRIDRDRLVAIAAPFQERQDLVPGHVAVDLQDELRLILREGPLHSPERLGLHPLHVNLDPLDRGIGWGDPFPDGIQADGEDLGDRAGVIHLHLGIDHAAVGGEAEDRRGRMFGEGERDRHELIEAVRPAGPLQAGGGGQGRLKGVDPTGRPDAPTKGQAGVAAVGADVEPGLAGAHVCEQPVGQLALGVAADGGRVVVPRGDDPETPQGPAKHAMRGMPTGSRFADERFQAHRDESSRLRGLGRYRAIRISVDRPG